MSGPMIPYSFMPVVRLEFFAGREDGVAVPVAGLRSLVAPIVLGGLWLAADALLLTINQIP